jgi:hypothetical protein
MRPVRIVLSRRPGFDLQAASQAVNTLPARSVARPGRWGNPFTIDAIATELGIDPASAQAEAVRRHQQWLLGAIEGPRQAPDRHTIRSELGGKNLACWCRAGTPCHVDNLLPLAND